MNSIDILLIILQKRWLIIKNLFVAVVLSALLSLLLPNWYRATSEIIPVNAESGGISSLLAGYSLNMVGKDAISPESYRIILGSQPIKDSLISKFDLFDRYNKTYKEEIYKIIDENIEVEIEKESGFGFEPIIGINISAIDKDPIIAAAISNYCVAFLDSTLKKMNKLYTKKKYQYIEKRYLKNLSDIEIAQKNIEIFQNKHGIFNLDYQMKASIEMIAELEAKREELYMQMDLLKSKSNFNPKLQMIKNEIIVTNNKIEEYSKGLNNIGRKSIVPPLNKIPQISNEFLALYRESRIQDKIFEMLSIEYEQAKTQLEKKIPSFLIVSYATVPTYKFKPKRILIVLTVFLIVFIMTVAWVMFQNYISAEQEKGSEKYRKINTIFELLKSDFRRKR